MNTANKRLVILSGSRGIGKSTVCQKVVEIARSRGLTCGGIITSKATDLDIIIEDIKTGVRSVLASELGRYSGPHFGKYSFNPQGLQFGVTAIKHSVSDDILFIDELGHLEVRGEGFAEAFEMLAGDRVNQVVVVIREGLLDVLLPRFTNRPHIFHVTMENRDTLAEQIVGYLSEHEALPPTTPA